MKYGRIAPQFVSSFALLAVSSALAGCSGEPSQTEEASLGAARSAISVPDDAIAQTQSPLRALETPGPIYMKNIRETFPGSGTFAHSIHVYQPDGNGESISFELTAVNSSGVVDSTHAFQSVQVASHPGQSDETRLTLPNASGQRTYTISTSRAGWYRVNFQYVAPNTNRTLTFRAIDSQGNALKTYWSDPSGANVQVKATVRVDQASQTYLKGGAYRNAGDNEYAYIDNVKVDGSLLYRRGFDQGQFNYPLGRLSVADHTVEFSFTASGTNPSYLWFGVNQQSFDPINSKAEWDKVQFLYRGAMHTGDYDAWNEGVAFAQGPNLVAGVRPPPIRRGATFGLAIEDPSLNGTSANATLRVYQVGSGTQMNWSWAQNTAGDYTGGIWTSTGFSTRYREHWAVQVPSNAAVGRYVVRAYTPSGSKIGPDAMFYVIHNPYTLLTAGGISKQELETYAYDEDADGVTLSGNYGSDLDNARDHYTALYEKADSVFSVTTKLTAAFKRTHDASSYSMLDYAMAASHGTATEFESMRRFYRVVGQRLRYTHFDLQDDSSTTLFGSGDGTDLSLDDAVRVSQPGTELSNTTGGQCQDYSSVLAALARASGIVSRVISAQSGLGGWGLHYFTEAYIPDLPHQGGKAGPTSNTDSDQDHWYVFDATDATSWSGEWNWQYSTEAIAPRAQYAKAATLISGPPSDSVTPVTTKVDWTPLYAGPLAEQDVLSVASAYYSGPEFWLTASGATGWLGFGEKAVYRVNKELSNASAVHVSTLYSGGSIVTPMLCVASTSAAPPIMPEPCAAPSTSQVLPPGESYVVVFNIQPSPTVYDPGSGGDTFSRVLKGDSIQYSLELETTSGACNGSNSVDMGAPGTNVTVANNGCLKVTQYPSWWGTRTLQLQSATPGAYPVPVVATNCGVTQGSGTFTGDWQNVFASNISQGCTTFVKLNGDGRGNITLRYFG